MAKKKATKKVVKKTKKKLTSKYRIEIQVDTNDADYMLSSNTISAEELKRFKPLIKAIKDHDGDYNYPVQHADVTSMYDQFDEELHEDFLDLCPTYDFHTITSIVIYPAGKSRKKLL